MSGPACCRNWPLVWHLHDRLGRSFSGRLASVRYAPTPRFIFLGLLLALKASDTPRIASGGACKRPGVTLWADPEQRRGQTRGWIARLMIRLRFGWSCLMLKHNTCKDPKHLAQPISPDKCMKRAGHARITLANALTGGCTADTDIRSGPAVPVRSHKHKGVAASPGTQGPTLPDGTPAGRRSRRCQWPLCAAAIRLRWHGGLWTVVCAARQAVCLQRPPASL